MPYFHVVFTLPAQIAEIAYQNKAVTYDLLFKASSETMLTIAASSAAPTTPVLWANPVMGSWRRFDRAFAAAATNPTPHYERRFRSAISLSGR